jgi:NAD(P)-dependent dehydrogenase (short-subunit alcohol dehydrogenase family)
MTSAGVTGRFGLARSRFDSWVVVVTGAASGIGRSVAQAFAAEGARLALLDIDADGLGSLTSGIGIGPRDLRVIRCDVGSEADVQDAFERIGSELGPIRVLVNNAFTMPVREKPEVARLSEWTRTLQVNLTGYFLCARAAGTSMIAARRGSIVNMSSIGGSSALGRGNLAYSVAKAGILQLTRELAIEWAQHGIRVNAVQPCQTMTSALQAYLERPEIDKQATIGRFLTGIPLGRIAEPEEIARAVLFLSSDDAAMVTGVALPVDGGNLALNAGGATSW